MARYEVYVNVSIVTAIIATLALSSAILVSQPVSASLGESTGQKKNVWCHNEYHTQNFCDGYHLGAADCENPTSDKYRGNEKYHTKDWRDGYNLGWTKGGGQCVIP